MNNSRWLSLYIVSLIGCMLTPAMSEATDHPGADLRWDFRPSFVSDEGEVRSRDGEIYGKLSGDLNLADGGSGPLLLGGGARGMLLLTRNHQEMMEYLPEKEFTISCWVVLEEVMEWGSVFCCLQDNGGFEKGWLLGTRRGAPCLGLASVGSDDGDGMMTYLEGTTRMDLGKWHHLAGSYDGEKMKIYLDGQLAGESDLQSGAILYPDRAPLVIGAYYDDNEHHPHVGTMQDMRLWTSALTAAEVKSVSMERPNCVESDPPRPPLTMAVAPYLQWATQHEITVCFETSRTTFARVEFGTTSEMGMSVTSSESKLHHVRLADLQPGTPYFYRVSAQPRDSGQDEPEAVASEVLTFQTASDFDTAFGFLVVGDTQNNPEVTKTVSDLAWGYRPNFIVHCGDLVGTGSNKREWVHEFFAAAKGILGRYAMFPTLGNHEQNAALYYDYFKMPEPEYYYQYRWGNTDFFVLDTNKPISKNSEQVEWLDAALAASDATWKVVYHHHPAWTSDENDYGDTWKGFSSQGFPPVQDYLVPIYEKHDVDVVFNGHIHVYERTWPIRDRKTVGAGEGVIYITTGGGGGSLEDFAPNRTWFSCNKRVGHHFLMVNVNGSQMEISAYDTSGRLFDRILLEGRGSHR